MSQAVQEATLTFISGNNDHPRRSAAKSLCKGLLRKSPASRFGSMDYMDIFGHSYFSDVDFAKLPVFEMPLSIEELEVCGLLLAFFSRGFVLMASYFFPTSILLVNFD